MQAASSARATPSADTASLLSTDDKFTTPSRGPGTPSAFTVKKKIGENDQPGSVKSTIRKTVKRKRKLTDKTLPAKVEEFVLESEVYKKLLELEKRVDTTIMRKRVDAFDAYKRPVRTKKTLRIFLSTKGNNQDEDTAEDPSWTFRLEGRLLDDKDQPARNKRKFSSFVRKIFMEFDPAPQESRHVEWQRDPAGQECDGFEIKRLGSDTIRCKLILLLDNQPELFKVGPSLAKILGLSAASRTTVTLALWEYIKKHKLMDKNDRTTVNCDSYLEEIFRRKLFQFTSIPELIAPFLLPLDPIEIDYIISADGNGEPDACYDVDLDVEESNDRTKAQSFMQGNPLSTRELTDLDTKITELVEQIKEAKARRDFMLNFATDPIGFIQKWIISQHRDLKTMTDLNGNPEEERHAEFYNRPWAEEAVWKYISEKSNEKRRQLEQHLAELKNN